MNDDAAKMPDLSRREIALFVPLVFLVLYLGVFPGYVLDRLHPSVDRLITLYEAGLQKGQERRLAVAAMDGLSGQAAAQIMPAAGLSEQDVRFIPVVAPNYATKEDLPMPIINYNE